MEQGLSRRWFAWFYSPNLESGDVLKQESKSRGAGAAGAAATVIVVVSAIRSRRRLAVVVVPVVVLLVIVVVEAGLKLAQESLNPSSK